MTEPAYLPDSETELAREETGGCRRHVSLRVSPERATISGQDTGEVVREYWGDGDYEFWTSVEAEHFPALIHALLFDKYRGNPRAVDQFRDFCEQHGIDCTFGNWA